MLDPTTSDPSRSRHCGRASVAATAVAALLLTGCAGSTAATPLNAEQQQAVAVRSSADIVGFDDGLDHYVVSTGNDPSRPTVATTTGSKATAPAEREPVTVAAGALVTDDPPAGLVPVTAVAPAEQAALDAADAGSFVVEDVHGLVGEPGRRYLRTLDRLYQITDMPVRTMAAEPAPVVTGGGLTDAAIRDAVDEVDGVVAAEIVGTGLIAVTTEPTTDARGVAEVPGVTAVADEVVFGLHADSRQPLQWAIDNTGDPAQANGTTGLAGADTGADLGWSVTTGAGTVVAIIDSGVDLTHPDLAVNIWSNPGETCANGIDDDANGYIDDCHGWDFGDGDGDPNPAFGSRGAEHGTHVAGIVAGARNGTGIVGIAPDATILPVKVGDSSGRITMSSLAAAITYASRYADVISMSLGTSPGTPRASVADLEAAVAAAGRAGVTVVTAMGNDGVDISSRPVWPASFAAVYDHVIAVGASTNSDTRAYFSNTGSPLTIYAPGWAIMSSLPTTGWGFLYGTSMATPAVAGAVASMLAAGTATTPARVRSRLVATASPTPAGPRLDVAAAVGSVPPAAVPALSVTLGGADRLTPDTSSTLTWSVVTRDPSSAVALRLSVAARDGGVIGAVEGLDATLIADGNELGTLVTEGRGEFPPVPVDATALAGGVTIEATLALPASEYAFVVELVDAGGLVVSPAVANFVSVTAAPPLADPDAATTTTTTIAITTTTTVAGTPATNAPSNPSNPSSPTTTQPASTGNSGGAGTPGTTQAPQPPDGAPTTQTPGAPVTTDAPTSTGGPPVPSTTTPTTPTTPATPATPVSSTTSPPLPTPPGTTLPPPEPATDGGFRADAITPRSGSVSGGTSVTIDGVFPTSVPVYVWFGDSWSASVRADASGSRITVVTPAVPMAGTRDVIIRFSTDRSFELRLVEAFQFTDGSIQVPATTLPGGSVGGGGSGGGAVTPPAPAPAPAPAPPSSSPATIAPPSTPTTTAAPSVRALGRLTLRTVPTGSALAALHVSAWPGTGCRTAACPGTEL